MRTYSCLNTHFTGFVETCFMNSVFVQFSKNSLKRKYILIYYVRDSVEAYQIKLVGHLFKSQIFCLFDLQSLRKMC